jgi:hypothetical protein
MYPGAVRVAALRASWPSDGRAATRFVGCPQARSCLRCRSPLPADQRRARPGLDPVRTQSTVEIAALDMSTGCRDRAKQDRPAQDRTDRSYDDDGAEDDEHVPARADVVRDSTRRRLPDPKAVMWTSLLALHGGHLDLCGGPVLNQKGRTCPDGVRRSVDGGVVFRADLRIWIRRISSTPFAFSGRNWQSVGAREGRTNNPTVRQDFAHVVEDDHAVAQQAPRLLRVGGDRMGAPRSARPAGGKGGCVGHMVTFRSQSGARGGFTKQVGVAASLSTSGLRQNIEVARSRCRSAVPCRRVMICGK